MCFKAQLFYLDYHSLRVENIELHAPTSSTQKLKLMGRGGQFIYISTILPLVVADQPSLKHGE